MKIAFWKRSEPAPAANALPVPMSHGKRIIGSMRSVARSMFRASKQTPLDSWAAMPVPPDQYISNVQPVLVARSREQWSNNDYVKAFVRIVRQNIVGPKGILLQAKVKTPGGKLDKRVNAAIESAWKAWGRKENADVAQRLTFRAIQMLCAETAARDGEYILQMVYGADAGPWGFSLKVIDPQRLPIAYNVERYTDSTFIRNGIEFTNQGKPVAYHFESTDDSDARLYYSGGRGFLRVPADQVVHGFVTEMASQRRGLPWMSTSLFRLHHLEGFENAAVQNARAGASKMGFIQYKEGFGPEADEGCDVASTIDAEPLSFHELPEGAELAKFDPQYPNGEFAVFHKAMMRGAAAGMGVQYNTLANDLEGVNFSSIRQGALDEREHWKSMQEWLMEDLMGPVYAAWLRYSLLAGKITTDTGRQVGFERFAACLDVIWQGRRWPWIDPRADVDGAIAECRAGMNSFSNVIRERGRDPQEVFTELAQDLKDMSAAGITDEFLFIIMSGAPKKPEPKQPQPKEGSE